VFHALTGSVPALVVVKRAFPLAMLRRRAYIVSSVDASRRGGILIMNLKEITYIYFILYFPVGTNPESSMAKARESREGVIVGGAHEREEEI